MPDASAALVAPYGAPSRPWRAIGSCLAVFLAALLVYANSICTLVPFGGVHLFAYDDNILVVHEPAVRSLSPHNVVRIFTSTITGAYRPLRVLSYAVDYSLWGLNPVGFHLTNVLLHGVNCVLVCLLVRRLARNGAAAILAAALFAVHPALVESVACVSGRKDLLGTLFVLASFLSYTRAFQPGGDRRFYGLSLLFFLLGMGAKEVMVVLPAILIAYEICFSAGNRLRNILHRQPPFLLMAVGFLLVWRHFLAPGHGPVKERYGMAFAVKGLGGYLRLLVLPVRLQVDYRAMAVPDTFLDWTVLASLVAVGVLGVAALLLLRKAPCLTLAVGWFFAAILPVSNLIIPIGANFSERFLYLPAVGGCMALGWALGGLLGLAGRDRRVEGIAAFLIAVLLFLLAAQTVARNSVWQSDRTLWEDAVWKSPGSWAAQKGCGEVYLTCLKGYPFWWRFSLPHFQRSAAQSPQALAGLAQIEMFRGNWAEAERLATLHTTSQPGEAAVWAHLGEVYARQAKWSEAADYYRKATALSPWDAQFRRDLARVYLAEDKPDEALAELNEVARVAPFLDGIEGDTGTAYLAKGRYPEAIAHLQRALAQDPSNAKMAHNLAYAHEQMGELGAAKLVYDEAMQRNPSSKSFLMPRRELIVLKLAIKEAGPSLPLLEQLGNLAASVGRRDEAIRCLKQAEALDPKSADVQCLLAGVYVAGKEFDEAEECLKKAMAVSPDRPGPWLGYALFYAAQGDNDKAMEHLDKAVSIGGEQVKRVARVMPAFAALRRDPRFQKLLQIGGGEAPAAMPP